jgi:hypothetical protein
MLIEWKRERLGMTLESHPDPSELGVTVGWEVTNRGITNPQVIQLAQFLGLKTVPPMTLTLKYLARLLRFYGPLWTNGKTHIVVIGGVDEARGRVRVYDPGPAGQGKIEWRSYQWYLSGKGADSRDTDASVRAVSSITHDRQQRHHRSA